MIRLTRMPAKKRRLLRRADREDQRPSGVACSTTPNITARMAKKRIDQGMLRARIGRTPMFERRVGKPPIVSVGRITCAIPRKSVSVPIVTASDGRPSR